jgi:hypothetical protein
MILWAVLAVLAVVFAVLGAARLRLVAAGLWLGLAVLVLRDARAQMQDSSDTLAALGAPVLIALWAVLLGVPLLGYGAGHLVRRGRRA